jgi:hypothetical protein
MYPKEGYSVSVPYAQAPHPSPRVSHKQLYTRTIIHSTQFDLEDGATIYSHNVGSIT